jgi:hypothetical protein
MFMNGISDLRRYFGSLAYAFLRILFLAWELVYPEKRTVPFLLYTAPFFETNLFPTLSFLFIDGGIGGDPAGAATGVATTPVAGPFLRWFAIDFMTPVRMFVTIFAFLIAHLLPVLLTAQYRPELFLMYTRGFRANVCAVKRVLVNPGIPGDAGAGAGAGAGAAAVARVNVRIFFPPGPSTYSPPRGPLKMVRPFEFF